MTTVSYGMVTESLTSAVDPNEIWIQWEMVFNQAAHFIHAQGGTWENAIKNHKYPNGLNLTKNTVVKVPYDEQKNYFIDEYGDKVKMLWKVYAPDGIFYFSRRDVICPSGDVLMFD